MPVHHLANVFIEDFSGFLHGSGQFGGNVHFGYSLPEGAWGFGAGNPALSGRILYGNVADTSS